MLVIVQRGGATHEKPPEVVRGPASRLPWAWDGLCFAVPFNDATRNAARDLVFNAAPSTVSGSVNVKDDRGNQAVYLNNTSYISYPDNPAHNRPSTAITVYVRTKQVGPSDQAAGGLLSKRYAATSPWLSWGIIGEEPGGHLTVSGGVNTWFTAYPLSTTSWSTVVLRWRTGSDATLNIYSDRGTLLASAARAQGAINGTIDYATGQPITFNATEDNTINADQQYSQAMVWSRVLTDTEIQALVADPYGWYSPRRETVGVSSPYPLFGGESLMIEVPSG